MLYKVKYSMFFFMFICINGTATGGCTVCTVFFTRKCMVLYGISGGRCKVRTYLRKTTAANL